MRNCRSRGGVSARRVERRERPGIYCVCAAIAEDGREGAVGVNARLEARDREQRRCAREGAVGVNARVEVRDQEQRRCARMLLACSAR